MLSPEQTIHVLPRFQLESGAQLQQVPVAYKTWGTLNAARDNVMVICHAFTGSADIEDWWGPLLGRGKAFDPSRYFIFCGNVLGSPYGSASPVTLDPHTGKPYGPQFPLTTIRDDVRIHKYVLDHLGVTSIAVVIGGSMGGMAVLEWPLCTPKGYVRHIIPMATSARNSAWCIAWGETQRQCILSDPGYNGGEYTSQPSAGLAAARMCAMLTYRSRNSFESIVNHGLPTPPSSPTTLYKTPTNTPASSHPCPSKQIPSPHGFCVQSYLGYQGEKFISRFDANCYIHITHKMDTHDLARGRTDHDNKSILSTLPPQALVVSIESDDELADHIPNAELVTIPSPDGHDGFLLEFERINTHITTFLKREFPTCIPRTPVGYSTMYLGRPKCQVRFWI
ncbi:Alpha/Beta hydrolase protein [Infundibulicybe gibba]|nr:Alpha/Beta hydrolase protein [Infundibulicybe gibba]